MMRISSAPQAPVVRLATRGMGRKLLAPWLTSRPMWLSPQRIERQDWMARLSPRGSGLVRLDQSMRRRAGEDVGLSC